MLCLKNSPDSKRQKRCQESTRASSTMAPNGLFALHTRRHHHWGKPSERESTRRQPPRQSAAGSKRQPVTGRDGASNFNANPASTCKIPSAPHSPSSALGLHDKRRQLGCFRTYAATTEMDSTSEGEQEHAQGFDKAADNKPPTFESLGVRA